MNQNKVFSASILKHNYHGSQNVAFEIRDFYLYEHETVLLKGPSGVGKTTLLRLIENSLDRKGCEIQKDNPTALIYQDLRLVAERSVLENILSGTFKDISAFSLRFEKTHRQKAIELLKKVGLSDFENKLVSELSGGQKQRVAIVRALINSPKILLADECFNQLDKKTALDVFSLIKSLQSDLGFTFLASQHSSVIDESKFDRQIEVPQNAITIKKNHRQKFSFLAFWIIAIIATVTSVATLDFAGLNSTQAFSEAFSLLLRFIQIDVSVLQQISWIDLLKSFLVTLKIALIGSLSGFLLALPLAVMSARNISHPFISKPVRFFLMSLRTIPSLVWALIFVAAFGIGAISGAFALTFYSAGYLGKMIYESLEDLDQSSYASIRRLGASRYQAFMMSLFPKARPFLVAHFLFMFEYNIRAASLLGLVGAGGIGQDLMYNLEWRRFPQAGVILLVMILIIFTTDKLSNIIRKNLVLDRGK